MGRPLEKLDPEGRVVVKNLKGHHRSMAREKVAGGLRNCELARMYGMTEAQVSIVVNSPAFLVEEARLEAAMEDATIHMRNKLRLMVPDALGVLEKELERYDEDGDVKDRALSTKVAFDVLERVAPKTLGREEGGGNTFITNIDIKSISTDKLRDNVFDMLGES